MGQRILFGTLAIIALLALFLFDVLIARWYEDVEGPFAELLQRGSILPLLFLMIVLLGSSELAQLFRQSGVTPHVRFAYVMIAVLMLTPWLAAAGCLGNLAGHGNSLFWPAVWLIVAAIGCGVLSVVRGRPEGTTRDFGATLLMVVYLGFLPSFALQIRSGNNIPAHEAAFLLFLVLLLTKVSDIGAYFVGSTIGRHKLIPAISPGKTIEGTIGGLLSSGLIAALIVLAALWAEPPTSETGIRALVAESTGVFTAASGYLPPVARGFFLGVLLSVFGQIGDLIESCFKREAGMKHSRGMIPHYGGILDLIDSPVVSVPVAWLFLTVFWRTV